MSEDLRKKFESMSLKDMRDLFNKSDALTEEEKTYLSDTIRDAWRKERKDGRAEFSITDSQKVDGDVAMVFDLDETLVRRGRYLQNENNEYIGETDYTLARPGLFELLDGLRKMKQQYEADHPGYKFNIYAFTSGTHINTDEFQSFLGEKYSSLFKDFFNSDSDEYVRTRTKGIHLFPEDTVLYFGDMDAEAIWGRVAPYARDSQRILCYEITGFNGQGFENALVLREYNRTLFGKIQEMIQNGNKKANSYKTKLDELSIRLLDYFDKVKKYDRIDVLLETIASQLNGENNDPVYSSGRDCDRKSACKKVEIPSIKDRDERNQMKSMREEYEELFNEVYGKESLAILSNIENSVRQITQSRYSHEHINHFEEPNMRARIHPAEIYPHSKRYMNADKGEEEDR